MQKLTITGKQVSTGNIIERVKTFEDACCELGIQSSELSVSGDLEKDFKSLSAYTKLIIIARALNEGWDPDWTNSSQRKYFPWFNMSSGSGLSFDRSVGWITDTIVGSRLCFKSKELADYAGSQFTDIYSDFLIL